MKNLRDFEINKEYECADNCPECNSQLYAKITVISKNGKMGDVSIYCKDCDFEMTDLIGWQLSKKQYNFYGKFYHPEKSRINISICHDCEKIARSPIILFINEGKDGALNFCTKCAVKLGILNKIMGVNLNDNRIFASR